MNHFHAPKEAKDRADLDDFLYYPVYQIINKTMHALQDCDPIKFPPIVPPLSLSVFSKAIEGQSNIDSIQEDDIKLTQFLLELAIHEKFQSYGGFKTPPNESEDIITHSLRLFINSKDPGKVMPTWLVFGAALLLDIVSIKFRVIFPVIQILQLTLPFSGELLEIKLRNLMKSFC